LLFGVQGKQRTGSRAFARQRLIQRVTKLLQLHSSRQKRKGRQGLAAFSFKL
jgi:hypothetical protein